MSSQRCSSVTATGVKCKNLAVADGQCSVHLVKTCVVCLEEIGRRPGTLKKLSPCKHEFHTKCIFTWFETSDECPLCKTEQDADPIIVFKKHVEENLRLKYRDAIKSLEAEVARLERARRTQN